MHKEFTVLKGSTASKWWNNIKIGLNKWNVGSWTEVSWGKKGSRAEVLWTRI
jgi:hypothetical protein